MEMRLQRALAQAGIASRRQAEELIREGKVRVDGKVATIGTKVDLATQRVTVGRQVIEKPRLRWMAFHKPMGVVTTASDEQGRRTVYDVLPNAKGLAYVGRLDVNTTGLLLLTTDGDAIHRLTHPKYRVARRYTALVHGRPTEEVAHLVQQPVAIDGRPVVTDQVRVRPGNQGRSIVDVTLREGRNRVVRRWAEALGLKVERLARLQYGPVRLGDLPVGEARLLTPKEEDAIYAAIKLKHKDGDE
jgi:23S rRNA pseudouridine2605 synthase